MTLIEQIQRNEVTQMYIDTTGVCDCVRNKALVHRHNYAMHHKCQFGRGMWISENECARDCRKYNFRFLVSASIAHSMSYKYESRGDRT